MNFLRGKVAGRGIGVLKKPMNWLRKGTLDISLCFGTLVAFTIAGPRRLSQSSVLVG
jgi:hypothetical protein